MSQSRAAQWAALPPRRSLLAFAGGALAAGLPGCSIPTRLAAVPRGRASDATVLGVPNERFFPTEAAGQAGLQREFVAAVQRQLASRGLPPDVPVLELDLLGISGGGENGAFGAGLLNGWTERGGRPTFFLVTGISTGALSAAEVSRDPQQRAPAAFLQEQDGREDIAPVLVSWASGRPGRRSSPSRAMPADRAAIATCRSPWRCSPSPPPQIRRTSAVRLLQRPGGRELPGRRLRFHAGGLSFHPSIPVRSAKLDTSNAVLVHDGHLRRPRSLRSVALVVLALLVLLFAVSITMERSTPSSAQAVVQAYVVAMAAEVPGRVRAIGASPRAALPWHGGTRRMAEEAGLMPIQLRGESRGKHEGAEADREWAEVRRAEAETRREARSERQAAADDQRTMAEEGRRTAEEVRVSAELGRVAAEFLREAREELREAREEMRQVAEEVRAHAERLRAEAEAVRTATQEQQEIFEEMRKSARADGFR